MAVLFLLLHVCIFNAAVICCISEKKKKKPTPYAADTLSAVSVCVPSKSLKFTSLEALHLHTRPRALTHTAPEIAALYLNEYSQSQYLINVPASLCRLQSEKQSTSSAGWINRYIDTHTHRWIGAITGSGTIELIRLWMAPDT